MRKVLPSDLFQNLGFTLLELLIVMALLVVMAGMAFPNMKRMVAQVQFQSSAENLHAALSRLHDRALWERKIMQVSIDPEKNEYRTYERGLENKAVTSALPQDVRIESDKDEILFYPDGSIDRAHITLADSQDGMATLMTQGVFGGIKLQFK